MKNFLPRCVLLCVLAACSEVNFTGRSETTRRREVGSRNVAVKTTPPGKTNPVGSPPVGTDTLSTVPPGTPTTVISPPNIIPPTTDSAGAKPTTPSGPGLKLAINISIGGHDIDFVETFYPISRATLPPPLEGTENTYEFSFGGQLKNDVNMPAWQILQLRKMTHKATVRHLKTSSGFDHTLSFSVETHGLTTFARTPIPDQRLQYQATNTTAVWSRNEGLVPEFKPYFPEEYVAPPSTCLPSSNHKNPTNGLYAVVLSNPATCDFMLPTVRIKSLFGSMDIPIGTYWAQSADPAHDFPASPGFLDPSGLTYPAVDNGFILIQPDGKTYLLVDQGAALPKSDPRFRTLARIANDVSASLGFGSTVVLRPTPSTTFLKGSVIALYDESPDMSGEIDFDDIFSTKKGFYLKWSAEEK